MKINPLIVLLFLALFFSCSSNTEKTEQALRKEIMDTHNEIMPKMNNIQELKTRLLENKDSLTQENFQPLPSGGLNVPQIDSLIQALDAADESMMAWMENYNEFNEESFTHAQQMAYLQEEKEKIESVKLKVLSSIMEAQAVLGDRPYVPED
jgi:DNA repair exonuclease SbcCD ATPase subunit